MSALIQEINQYYAKKHYPILHGEGCARIQTAFEKAFHNLLPTISTSKVKDLLQELDHMVSDLEGKISDWDASEGWRAEEIHSVLELASAVERDMAIRSLLKDCPNLPDDLTDEDGEICMNQMVAEKDFPDVMLAVRRGFYADAKQRLCEMRRDLDTVVRHNSTKELIRFLAEYDISLKQQPAF